MSTDAIRKFQREHIEPKVGRKGGLSGLSEFGRFDEWKRYLDLVGRDEVCSRLHTLEER